MRYKAKVIFNGKIAKQTYNSDTQEQRIVNENGFVIHNTMTERNFLNLVKAFESKAFAEGFYFQVKRFIGNKWVTYLEVEN
jgi:predicted NAD/FAD-binding protein